MKRTMSRAMALRLAERIVDRLRPGCERIEIAGSLRRGCEHVGDIEIVVLPKIGQREDVGLFAEPASLLDPILSALEADHKLFRIKGGDKMRQYGVTTSNRCEPTLDLFIANPDNWGYILAIRTGPSGYSRHIVTQRCAGGALDDNYVCRYGHVWKYPGPDFDYDAHKAGGGNWTDIDGIGFIHHPVPNEEDFFDLVAGGWVHPHKRRFQ